MSIAPTLPGKSKDNFYIILTITWIDREEIFHYLTVSSRWSRAMITQKKGACYLCSRGSNFSYRGTIQKTPV